MASGRPCKQCNRVNADFLYTTMQEYLILILLVGGIIENTVSLLHCLHFGGQVGSRYEVGTQFIDIFFLVCGEIKE